MNKYKKLAGNSLILTIGNFGSRFVTFFLVPLYTAVLSTAEYGTVDLMTTTVSLLLPILTMELGQATIRYAVANKEREFRKLLFNNLMMVSLVITAILIIVSPFLNYFSFFGSHTIQFIGILILQVFNNLLLNFARGIGKVKEFALNGLLTTIVTVISNLILLLLFDWGVNGYIASIIISLIISNIFLFFIVDGVKLFNNFRFDIDLLKELITFSIPLVPNSILWWFVNGATRYFILFFVGVTGNGLYAVANKIPSIITSVMTIFNQAWQLSSFEEYDSKGRDEYYTNVFSIFYVVLFTVGSFLIVFNKMIMSILVSTDFYDSWKLVPFLLIAVIFQSFSNFFGTVYTASGMTKKTFVTTMYGAVSSIIANLIFVPIFAEIGASLAVCLSFILVFFLRFNDIKKVINIKLNFLHFSANFLILGLQTLVLLVFNNDFMYVILFVLLAILLIINHSIILSLINSAFKVIKNFFVSKFT